MATYMYIIRMTLLLVFEQALCINSTCQQEAAVASNKKVLILIDVILKFWMLGC